MITQGAEANRSGQYGEQRFEAAARAFKIPIVADNKGYHGIQLIPRYERLIIRQPLIDFEFRDKRADYLYKDYARNVSILIEVKSQIGRGTTDEKLIHTVEDLERCPFACCLVVLFGSGFRKWVVGAALRKAREVSGPNKRVRVLHALDDSILYRHMKHLVEQGELLP